MYIRESVLDALKQRGCKGEEIKKMTPEEIFVEYCEWNGLIRWGETLWAIMNELQRK